MIIKPLAKQTSLLLLLLLPYFGEGQPSNEERRFLDLLGLMEGRERFRLQYELNGIPANQTKLQSLLVDESYSFELQSGRLLLDPAGLADLKPNGYNTFYWFRTSQLQESFWLKPFVCSSSVVSLDDAPIRSGLLDALLPEPVKPLTAYLSGTERLGPSSKQFTLHGLAALLVNTFNQSVASTNDLSWKWFGGNHEDEPESVEWTWKVNSEYKIDFSLLNLADSQPTKQLENLKISFNKVQADGKELCLAQLKVLKLDFSYPDEQVFLPQGYSCQRSSGTKLLNVSVVPLSSQRGLRRKFTLEVTVTRGEGLHNGRFFGHFQVPKPLESIAKPQVESRILTWLEDELNKQLIVIGHLRADLLDPSKEISTIPPSLTFYDFSTMRKRVVHGQTGPCDQATGFKSSLFSKKQDPPNMYRPIDFCNQEEVEIELSKELNLRLNPEGLKLLQFNLQDREHAWHLIDQIKLPADNNSNNSNKYEMVYEQTVNDKLCIYDKKGKQLITTKPVKLISRYLYDATKGLEAAKRWTAKSSSLLFFAEYSTGLQMQIDLKLLHFEDYNPWEKPSHLLDLTPCFLAPKQSATLTLEYPLSKETNHLRQFDKPHKAIRECLANHFRISYSLNWARLPSMEVNFLSDRIEVKLRLLDQSHLLDDSKLMPISRASKSTIMSWLSQSLRSVLLASLEACAEYCQQYHCQVYTYCKYSSSCYLFNELNSLTIKSDVTFGSFRAGELDCPSYSVSANRLESANVWRKNSWSLEETLESVVNAVLQPEGHSANPYTNVAGSSSTEGQKEDPISQHQLEESLMVNPHRLSVMRPNLDLSANVKGYGFSMLARLKASFAHYTYDNLHGSVLATSDPNPFALAVSGNQKVPSSLHGQLSNFRIALAGYEYVESTGGSVKVDQQLLTQTDLEDGPGWLSLNEPDVESCARICLADLNCASFSYCSTNTDNGDASNCLISTLDNQRFSVLLDALLNGFEPLEEPQQSNEWLPVGRNRTLTLRKNPYCSVMMRTYSDQFHQLELKMIYSTREVPLTDVESVQIVSSGDVCAGLCAKLRLKSIKTGTGSGNNNQPACLSYDFCRPFDENDDKSPSACVFYNKHQVSSSSHKELVRGDHNDTGSGPPSPARPGEEEEPNLLGLLKGELKLSLHTFCTHFVRNYLADFRKLAHKRLPADMSALRRANYRLRPEAEEAVTSSKDDQAGEEEEEEEGEELEEVSLEKCARLCEESPNCGAFQYCTALHKPAPGGLYLSCSLGGSETLELSPVDGQVNRKRQEADLKRLLPSKVCSVYIYRSLSMVLNHKKKNLAKLAGELEEEAKKRTFSEYLKMFRLDLIVLFFFLAFGFLVRDVDLRQFAFRRFSSSRSRRASGTGREPSIYPERLRPNEFNLERINPSAGD